MSIAAQYSHHKRRSLSKPWYRNLSNHEGSRSVRSGSEILTRLVFSTRAFAKNNRRSSTRAFQCANRDIYKRHKHCCSNRRACLYQPKRGTKGHFSHLHSSHPSSSLPLPINYPLFARFRSPSSREICDRTYTHIYICFIAFLCLVGSLITIETIQPDEPQR